MRFNFCNSRFWSYYPIILKQQKLFEEKLDNIKKVTDVNLRLDLIKDAVGFAIRSDVEDDRKNAVVEKFENLVGTLGGTVETLDKWGLKKFAYEIGKQTEGYYVLMNVTCSKEAQAEIDRQMRNDESILRQMILKK